MSEQHRYRLEDYRGMSNKHECPGCGKKKCFTYYIDADTNSPVHATVGRCDRLSKCGYHLSPKTYFAANGIIPSDTWKPQPPEPVKEPSYINQSILNQSLNDESNNNLITFLKSIFDKGTVDELVSKYLIGSTKNGSTVFWQVDTTGLVHAGKIIAYNPETGKRNKTIYPAVTWVHKKLKIKEFNLSQCLFGEHLLRLFPDKPCAIVESEKTAIIASVYLPQFIWLACGGLEQLSLKRVSVLQGRSVVLYPDLKGSEKWEDKAMQFGFQVSKTLETIATQEERENDLDLADYLMRFDVSEFSKFKGQSSNTVRSRIEAQETLHSEGFSTIIQDKEISAESTEEDFSTVTTRAEVFTIPQPDDRQVNQYPIPADVVTLQHFYSNLEDSGLIPDEHRNYIGSLFQGVMIYLKEPLQLMLYIEPLERLRIEIESINKKQIAI